MFEQFAPHFKTPDELSPTVLTLLWPKHATKLGGLLHPCAQCFTW